MDLLIELLDATPDTYDKTPAAVPVAADQDTRAALRFITCGSVDDGKSTLIGRLLLDSRSVLQDQLASVSGSGAIDLARFTDGLSAEREQGITIDVAYRYFSTARRKFIIGDAPGHEQYTRNMVTAASSADAAVVLVDATKLPWHDATSGAGPHALLAQTRRHALLVKLLRVPSVVFAINKLDAVADGARALGNISRALQEFAAAADIAVAAIVPLSALDGQNVVSPSPHWCGYNGPSLLQILEQLPVAIAETHAPLSFPVQWVEKFAASADTRQGRRIFWGRVATGTLRVGQTVSVLPGGQVASVAQVLDNSRAPASVPAGRSAGIVLEREVDVSRGDWLLAHGAHGADNTALRPTRSISATVAWLDDEPLIAGRTYLALHGHRWVKVKVTRIAHRLNVHTLEREDAAQLEPNAIGRVEITLQEPIAGLPYRQSRTLGAIVLVDCASHKTAGAALLD